MEFPGLYGVLEQFVGCAIPLWDETLSWFHDRIRINVEGTSDEDFYLPVGLKYETASDHSDGSDFWHYNDDYRDWKKQNRVLVHPEPQEFVPFVKNLESDPEGARPVDLQKNFADAGLQVIFKLANIHLSAEKPEYEGGSWHVEGALNEHICATALYYYDQENVTDSYLGFRQSINTEEMTMKPMQVRLRSKKR